MKMVGAFDRNDDEYLMLKPRGRYLLVAMMREFFANLNDVRDHARNAISSEEMAAIFEAQS